MTRCRLNKWVATLIVAGEIGCLGVAASSASAETDTQRRIARQQQVILQQQRQLQDYQRQLAAQQQSSLGDGGLFGVLGCPRGYTYSWFGEGCYPNLPAAVIVTSPR